MAGTGEKRRGTVCRDPPTPYATPLLIDQTEMAYNDTIAQSGGKWAFERKEGGRKKKGVALENHQEAKTKIIIP